MSSVESQKILAAYTAYKKTDLNRNNRAKLQEALNKAKQRATDTLNKLQAAFAPSQRIVQNFPTNAAIEAARQRALAGVAANPPSSGGSSNSRIQQQAQEFYNRNMPPTPTQIDPSPTVGTIIRTTDLLLSRLPKIPTTRAQYNSVYEAYSKIQTDFAAWLAKNPAPRQVSNPGSRVGNARYQRYLKAKHKRRRWEEANNAWKSRVRAARINWEQISWGSRNIEIRIKALKPFLDLDDLTRPEIAKAHNEITAASNTISRILNQKLFVERARLGDLQKLMLVVLDKKKTAERLNAAAMAQDTFAAINPANNPNLQPGLTEPPALPPEPTAPPSVFGDIGKAISDAFGGTQTELTDQAYMVMKANIEAAKRLEAEK